MSAAVIIEPGVLSAGAGRSEHLMRALRKDRLALAGLVLIIVVLILAVAGQWIAPYPAQGFGFGS